MTIAATTPLPGQSCTPAWIGGYRVLDCIAEGGMGRVFRALDTVNCRMVAMKIPLTGGGTEIACLRHEAATLKQLNHPGIVRLYAEGSWNGMPWMAMELLEGRTLLEELESIWDDVPGVPARAAALRRRSEEMPTVPGRLFAEGLADRAAPEHRPRRPVAGAGRLGEIGSIVVQLAMILEHLHGRGLVHRDLKPSNVFIRGGGRVALLDFGLTCAVNTISAAHGGNGLWVGTMQYAAPEQILGEATDARADVYSLGCVLYELVTGLRPFDGDTSHEVAQKHLYREPIAPSTLVSDLPWQLGDLILEMLAKKRGDRPASAGAAGARLTDMMRRWTRRPPARRGWRDEDSRGTISEPIADQQGR